MHATWHYFANTSSQDSLIANDCGECLGKVHNLQLRPIKSANKGEGAGICCLCQTMSFSPYYFVLIHSIHIIKQGEVLPTWNKALLHTDFTLQFAQINGLHY